MNRSEAQELLLEYLRQELPLEESRLVGAHIEADERLRKTAQGYQRLLDAEEAVRGQQSSGEPNLAPGVMNKVKMIEQGLSLEGRYASGASILPAIVSWMTRTLSGHDMTLAFVFCTAVILSLSLNLYTVRLSRSSAALLSPEMLQEVQVIVPLNDIPPGQALRAEMFKVASLPRAFVSPARVSNLADLDGQFSRATIKAGEPLQSDAIGRVLPFSVVNARVPSGMRAVVVKVDSTTLPSLESWAFPGNRADIMWTTTIDGYAGSRVIAENVEILSAERDFDAQNTDLPSMTLVSLAADEETARRIQLAQSTGAVSLQLRGHGDLERASDSRIITVNTLLDSQHCKAEVVFQNKLYCVRPNGILKPIGKAE